MGIRKRVHRSKLFIASFALLLISAGACGVGASMNAQPSRVQDLMSLERRVSLMEQRFYAIESRLNRLEQPAPPRREPPPVGARDSEINLLSNEIEQLRRRLIEVECGVVRLDERTKKASTGKSGDPCRQNPTEPVKLSVRP